MLLCDGGVAAGGEGEARRRRGETYRLFHSVCKTLLKMAKGRNYLDK